LFTFFTSKKKSKNQKIKKSKNQKIKKSKSKKEKKKSLCPTKGMGP
jgi:hypothetical protein